MPKSERNAVITGGASGMGRAAAMEFANKGLGVAIWDYDEDRAEEVAATIVKAGGRARAYRVDVASVAQVEEAARSSAADIGPLHILINSAGRSTFAPLINTTEQVFEHEIAVNLTGTFNSIKAVIPDMLSARWGRIVNVASIAGQTGTEQMVAYSASKAGVIGLTKAVAREFAGEGITCNAIAPGAIDTPMIRAAFKERNVTLEFAEKQGLMGRLGTVDEIAAACAYFISDGAAFVTGQILGVNGGAYT